MRVRVPRGAEPGLTLWAALAGVALGFLLAEVVFGERTARLEAQLAAIRAPDPTGAGD